MFEMVITRALAIELLLVVVEGVAPGLTPWLPVGGSQLSQVGACLALAVAYYELVLKRRGARNSDNPRAEEIQDAAEFDGHDVDQDPTLS
jgi:hypothetical protein